MPDLCARSWTIEFAGVVRDGKVFGRGACVIDDMVNSAKVMALAAWSLLHRRA